MENSVILARCVMPADVDLGSIVIAHIGLLPPDLRVARAAGLSSWSFGASDRRVREIARQTFS